MWETDGGIRQADAFCDGVWRIHRTGLHATGLINT